jgi:ubiquinone/menaquinone biosynthesis C-methylase UbiE
MEEQNELNNWVKKANRAFYDIAADVYESIDGRRTHDVIIWLCNTLKELSEMTSGEVLLDLGCGSGVVMNSGKVHFKKVYGIDISPEMLKIAKGASDRVICAESSSIPLKDNSVDVVVCFAVMHHILDHRPLLKEIFRVLKKGGLLYTDHDLDKAFNDKFSVPLKIYRHIFNSGKRYMRVKKEITKEMYKLSEVHSEGIDSEAILAQLRAEGFIDIMLNFHWFGLSKIFNILMKHKSFRRGFAPLVSIRARK